MAVVPVFVLQLVVTAAWPSQPTESEDSRRLAPVCRVPADRSDAGDKGLWDASSRSETGGAETAEGSVGECAGSGSGFAGNSTGADGWSFAGSNTALSDDTEGTPLPITKQEDLLYTTDRLMTHVDSWLLQVIPILTSLI